jgi:outer membrane protein assembly factor BamB
VSNHNNGSVVTHTETEHERAEVYCSMCAAANAIGLKYCTVCWSPLARPLANDEQRTLLQRRRNRDRLRRKLIRYSSLSIVAMVVAVYAFNLFVALPVSKPTTDINASVGPGDWGLEGRNVTHTAQIEQGPLVRGDLLWKFHTERQLLSSPVVAAGVVYQATGDARVLALDAESGALLWEQGTTGPVDRPLAVTAEAVYVGLRDGRLLALDRDTGHIRWSFLSGNAISAAPVVLNGVVYLGSGDGILYGLDARTGAELWTYDAGRWIVGMAIRENVIALATLAGDVWFVDLKTGKKRLEYNTQQATVSGPAFGGDLLFLGTDKGTVVALDSRQLEYPLERGIRYWRRQLFLMGYGTPPVPKGRVWHVRIRSDGQLATYSAPAVTADAVYLVMGNGTLLAFEPATGSRLWRYHAEAPADTSPVVVGDLIYMGTDSGDVHVVDRHTGTLVSTFHVGGALTGQLVMANDTLFVASRNGDLYALR